MFQPESPSRVSTLDDLIVNIVANDGYNKHVMSHISRPGNIDHPVTDWYGEMRQHSAEKYNLPSTSLFITKALVKCADIVREERDRGQA